MKHQNKGRALLLIPGLLVYLSFMIIPILLVFYYSFMDWDGLKATYNFIWFDNFIKAFKDHTFHRSIGVTLFITVVSTIIINIFGIFFAILLNKKSRITNFYRSVFFFPLLLSPVVVGFLWQTILNHNGVLNEFLVKLGFAKVPFLGHPEISIATITGIIIWQSLGFSIVLYLAGLQSISNDLYEAATIDGASIWQTFKNITFPMLAPALTMNIVFAFTGAMREYDRVAVLTGGGPGGSTETMAFQIVRTAFSGNRLSYGAALAVCMLIIVTICSLLITMYLRKREERII